ncbi:MAG: hypothetical protein ACXAC7_18825 [Candidatus Hodarchaeales archaeon]
MKTACHSEIIELHDFFTKWYSATIVNTDEEFSRFKDVMSNDFELITPNGEIFRHENVIPLIKSSYSSRKPPNQSFEIEIKNYKHRFSIKSIHIATYEEWQTINKSISVRLSTVIFQETKNSYNNLEWLHVHETWKSI